MKSLTSRQLNSQLQQVTQGIDQTIDWINTTRQHALRLDIEADQLTVKLRRQRHKARHLSEMSLTPMSIGFFGQSPAGKQHLIAALIADENGQLETTLAGKTLNFWQQIKPGYQSSGLVARFSHQVAINHDTHPVQLSLLNEIELAKIVVGAYLHDNQQDVVQHSLSEQYITDHLQQLAMRKQQSAIAGITPDDVISLWDYLVRHDAPRQKRLEAHFWPMAIELAPYLRIDDRAVLFSLLWAESPPLTEAYRHFAYTLQHLDSAPQLLAPLSVLVDDMLLPANGIMNVSTLNDLNTPADSQIQVLPLKDTLAGKSVTLSLAELTFLAVELHIPLRMSATENLFESVELVDFPDFSDEFDIPTQVAHSPYALAASLSRAKNAFLLERYTDRQQINMLLICNAVSHRSDVKAMGKLLDYWIKQSQGENTQVRSRRNPGLIWTLTPFDQRIVSDGAKASEGAKNHDEAVQRYVGQPGDSSWGTLLALDTRGIERMVNYLSQEIRRDIKAERITEQLNELQRELTENMLASWCQPATHESQQKQRIAETLLKALQTRTGLHGELLERLLPTRDELRALYLQQQNRVAELITSGDSHDPFSIGIDIDLFSDSSLSSEQPMPTALLTGADDDAGYAANVHRYWVNHLRQLPDNGPLIELLGITKPTIELLVAELITASIRLDVTGQLVKILADNEQVSLHRDSKADRQVSRALTVLGDFVAWLGFLQISETQRPDSRINRGYKIFARIPTSASPVGASQRLTKLAPTPTNNTAFYIYDWLVGLGEMIIHNEGYSASSEISEQHREQLAAILILVKQNQH
ncbi:putative virulence factor [Yersinia sp. LJYL362]|uniref:putative virulence factor n=1 Tax=Yersinia sp. LJYL362 TaxID=3402108 RepID=UPI003AB44BBD